MSNKKQNKKKHGMLKGMSRLCQVDMPPTPAKKTTSSRAVRKLQCPYSISHVPAWLVRRMDFSALSCLRATIQSRSKRKMPQGEHRFKEDPPAMPHHNQQSKLLSEEDQLKECGGG